MKKTLLCLLLAPAFAALATPATAHAETAYFSMVNVRPGTLPHEFIFAATDPATIATLREEILTGTVFKPLLISGRIERGRKPYNAEWNFHYVPETVATAASQVEVCDSDVFEIEDRIETVGGAFLPGNIWCPWSMRLVREVLPIQR